MYVHRFYDVLCPLHRHYWVHVCFLCMYTYSAHYIFCSFAFSSGQVRERGRGLRHCMLITTLQSVLLAKLQVNFCVASECTFTMSYITNSMMTEQLNI